MKPNKIAETTSCNMGNGTEQQKVQVTGEIEPWSRLINLMTNLLKLYDWLERNGLFFITG